MNKKIISHLALYAILLATFGQTGFLGGVYAVAYWIAVALVWVALFGMGAIITCLMHPKVQQTFRLAPDPNTPQTSILFGIVWGGVIAASWIYMQSPWLAAGSLVLTAMGTFLKFYRATKRDAY
jgi:hypothetical protein